MLTRKQVALHERVALLSETPPGPSEVLKVHQKGFLLNLRQHGSMISTNNWALLRKIAHVVKHGNIFFRFLVKFFGAALDGAGKHKHSESLEHQQQSKASELPQQLESMTGGTTVGSPT